MYYPYKKKVPGEETTPPPPPPSHHDPGMYALPYGHPHPPPSPQWPPPQSPYGYPGMHPPPSSPPGYGAYATGPYGPVPHQQQMYHAANHPYHNQMMVPPPPPPQYYPPYQQQPPPASPRGSYRGGGGGGYSNSGSYQSQRGGGGARNVGYNRPQKNFFGGGGSVVSGGPTTWPSRTPTQYVSRVKLEDDDTAVTAASVMRDESGVIPPPPLSSPISREEEVKEKRAPPPPKTLERVVRRYGDKVGVSLDPPMPSQVAPPVSPLVLPRAVAPSVQDADRSGSFPPSLSVSDAAPLTGGGGESQKRDRDNNDEPDAPPAEDTVEDRLKRVRRRDFCITYWGDSMDDIMERIRLTYPHVVVYIIYQREACPSSGRLHWQVYLEMKTPKDISFVKDQLFQDRRTHVKIRVTSRMDARIYCAKNRSRVAGPPEIVGPTEWGLWREQGSSEKMTKLREAIADGMSPVELVEEEPGLVLRNRQSLEWYSEQMNMRSAVNQIRKLNVRYFFGSTGSGKTFLARREAEYVCHGDIGKIFMLDSGGKRDALWFDGYQYGPVLIIDDYNSWIPIDFLLRILDEYPVRLPVKGSMKWARYTDVWITSNKRLEELTDPTGAPVDPRHFQALCRRLNWVVEVCGDGAYVIHKGPHAPIFGDMPTIEPFEDVVVTRAGDANSDSDPTTVAAPPSSVPPPPAGEQHQNDDDGVVVVVDEERVVAPPVNGESGVMVPDAT